MKRQWSEAELDEYWTLTEPYWWNLMKAEDFRALSPLIYAHINPYGIFNLDMSTRIPIGDGLPFAA